MNHQCVIEAPASFREQLTMKLNVELYDTSGQNPVDIIQRGQAYKVIVDVELGANIKRLLCGKWCVCVSAESIGPGGEPRVCTKIPMDNCNPKADRAIIDLPSTWFEQDQQIEGCGTVYELVVTVAAYDKCEKPLPIGLVGFCKLGPVAVY